MGPACQPNKRDLGCSEAISPNGVSSAASPTPRRAGKACASPKHLGPTVITPCLVQRCLRIRRTAWVVEYRRRLTGAQEIWLGSPAEAPWESIDRSRGRLSQGADARNNASPQGIMSRDTWAERICLEQGHAGKRCVIVWRKAEGSVGGPGEPTNGGERTGSPAPAEHGVVWCPTKGSTRVPGRRDDGANGTPPRSH